MRKQIIASKLSESVLIAVTFLAFSMKANVAVATQNMVKHKKPNVLFILIDDLGRTDVNVFDPLHRDYYETPNIDRLARQGIMFTRAYANAANCTPSRAAIMSGQQYPHEPIYDVGVHPHPGSKHELISAYNANALPVKKVTIAEALKRGGYTTAFIGKWGIGSPPITGPKQQGFDSNTGGYYAENPSVWKGGYYRPNNNPYIHDAHKGEYLTDYLTRKSMEFMKANKKGPFYLQLSYYAVHTPLEPKKGTLSKYQIKKGRGGHDNPAYAAMIGTLDDDVGKLMRTLQTLGIAKNTIVVLFSDNGGRGGYGFLGHGNTDITNNSPWKGGKTMFYQGGLLVPMIIRWPQVVSPGRKSDVAVTGMDIYPTLLAVAGLEKPINYVLDGESLLPILDTRGAKLPKRSLYWHFPGYPEVVWRTGPVSVILWGKWKLMKFYEEFYISGKVKLFDLSTDISEQHDVCAQHPKICEKLLTRLEIWLEENGAPMPKMRSPLRASALQGGAP